MRIGRLPNESDAYRKARDELLEAEIALKDQRERVAKLRRALPLDAVIEDYALEEGPADLDRDGPVHKLRLSDLFDESPRPVLVYQYMFGGAQKAPCPMCTMWTDGFNGVAHHIRRWAHFGIVAQAELGALRTWARKRGWRNLRLFSSAGSTLKTDLGFQNEAGEQQPGVSVFVRHEDGSLRHFYSGSAYLGDATRYRGLDLYTPIWNLMDLLPGGRGDWLPKLEYDGGA